MTRGAYTRYTCALQFLFNSSILVFYVVVIVSVFFIYIFFFFSGLSINSSQTQISEV